MHAPLAIALLKTVMSVGTDAGASPANLSASRSGTSSIWALEVVSEKGIHGVPGAAVA